MHAAPDGGVLRAMPLAKEPAVTGILQEEAAPPTSCVLDELASPTPSHTALQEMFGFGLRQPERSKNYATNAGLNKANFFTDRTFGKRRVGLPLNHMLRLALRLRGVHGSLWCIPREIHPRCATAKLISQNGFAAFEMAG